MKKEILQIASCYIAEDEAIAEFKKVDERWSKANKELEELGKEYQAAWQRLEQARVNLQKELDKLSTSRIDMCCKQPSNCTKACVIRGQNIAFKAVCNEIQGYSNLNNHQVQELIKRIDKCLN